MIVATLSFLLMASGPQPTCLADTTATAQVVVDRIAEIVTRRDGEMAMKRRLFSLPHVVRSEIRIETSGRVCRAAAEAYRRSLELDSDAPLTDLVVAKIGQERYVVVSVDRLDEREPSWAVYDRGWEEKILFRT